MKTLILILLILTCPMQAGAQTSDQKLQEAADDWWESFSKSITNDNYSFFGFQSLGDIKNLELGTGYYEYNISLSTIKNYQNGSKAETLITVPDAAVYTFIDKRTKAIIGAATFEIFNDVWKNTAVDAQKYPSLIEHAVMIVNNSPEGKDANLFIVRFPSLGNFDFIAFYGKNKKLMFSPFTSYPELSLAEESIVPAENVLDDLAAMARKYHDNDGAYENDPVDDD